MALKNEPLISNTIRDAITVVSKLGERYMWVENLCLLQDDEWEMRECVAHMDVFYEMATFTIIAAGSEDAFAGLEGVPPTRRLTLTSPVKEIVPGLRMTAIVDVDTLLQVSVYNNRAWTCVFPSFHRTYSRLTLSLVCKKKSCLAAPSIYWRANILEVWRKLLE
jgi:hypothetical protein